MKRRAFFSIGINVAFSACLLMTACKPAQEATKGVAPAVPVSVLSVTAQSTPLIVQLPGRTSSFAIAEVRPQVNGIIKQRLFTEGTEVKAGQALYQIDAALYQAAFNMAKANLEKAQASFESAFLKAKRYADLVTIDAISKQANDEAIAAKNQAQADIEAAKAALEKARIDMAYTVITSPISGRIGRSSVTAGALVTANQVNALATVQQLDPIYVDFSQSSTERLKLNRVLANGLHTSKSPSTAVALILEDGSVYASQGKLQFSEVTVDQSSGSVTMRAIFPNPKGELLPGMYVRVSLTQAIQSDAFLVPHAALLRDPKGNPFVMLVNAKNQVEARPVSVAHSLTTQWVITDGLKSGERVIVDGLQKIRPGSLVRPEEAKLTPSNAAQIIPPTPAIETKAALSKHNAAH